MSNRLDRWPDIRRLRELDEQDTAAEAKAEERRKALALDRRDRLRWLVEHSSEHPVFSQNDRDEAKQ